MYDPALWSVMSYQTAQEIIEQFKKTSDKDEYEKQLSSMLETFLMWELTRSLIEDNPIGLRAFLKARYHADFDQIKIEKTLVEDEQLNCVNNFMRKMLNLPERKPTGRPIDTQRTIEVLTDVHIEAILKKQSNSSIAEDRPDHETIRYHNKKATPEQKKKAKLKAAVFCSQQKGIPTEAILEHFEKRDPAFLADILGEKE